ncbi:hypothetical protein O3P69_020877 [Scylla paramamosain]|uniref:Uncharacterized protein n=1 Tax=Scylla paramamosain TaxID=85552 RepID=A0AAW0TPM1_SCYPA
MKGRNSRRKQPRLRRQGPTFTLTWKRGGGRAGAAAASGHGGTKGVPRRLLLPRSGHHRVTTSHSGVPPTRPTSASPQLPAAGVMAHPRSRFGVE